ncbi:MAG TPA: DUF362 domain-containing protein [Candidatus Brocadiia bacterium]|nr:DUF362 domain-containing protein [Candidatus Brocadiia bacterium]
MAAKHGLVAAVYTKPETVLDDVARLAELAGMKDALAPSATTILKDNISWHFPFPGANTTPWQLEGAIKALKGAGFNDLVCVENKTVVTNAHKGDRLNKYRGVLNSYGIPIKFNFEPEHMKWTVYKPKGEMLVLNRIFPEGIRVPDYFMGKNIVHLPTVKCHIYTTTTGAMKNAFGGLLNTKRHYTHSWIHETLVDLLTIQKEIHTGIFAIMDGTTAGDGPGPRTMRPKVKNVMLASADQAAIDAVAAKMMGFDPMSIGYIRIAHEKGLGIGDPAKIKVVGDDVSRENWGFTVGNNAVSAFGKKVWYGPFKPLQNLLFHTPLVYGFIFGSFFYHDFYHWPLKASKDYEKWLRETEWGKLFAGYE